MATSNELQDRLLQEQESDEQRRKRIQDAIDARKRAEDAQNQSNDSKKEAEDAEGAIDSDQG